MPDRNTSAKKKLALVVNGVLREFNFAVGGGYALELHGLTSRKSRDQDWFASLDDIVHSSEIWGYEFPHFGVLADKLVAALEASGYSVDDVRRSRLFAKLVVRDADGNALECDLTAHRRRELPVMIDGISVVGESDAIYGKFKALLDRAAARDFLDVRSIALKDRLDFFEALFYAKAADPDLDEEGFRAVLAQIEEMDVEEFSEYLSDESELDELRAFFRTWAG